MNNVEIQLNEDDVEIQLNEDCFDSWVWRKKTHTGVLLNYTAIAPTKWKFGLIICLLNRVWNICSSMAHFDREVETLKNMFKSNGYPAKFFDTAFLDFGTLRSSPKRLRTPRTRIALQ